MPASRPSEGTGPVPSASSNAADFLFSRRQLPFPGSQKPLSAPQPPPILTKPRRSSALHYDCIRQDHHRRCPAFFQPEPSTEPAPCARSCLFQKAHPPHKSTYPRRPYPTSEFFCPWSTHNLQMPAGKRTDHPPNAASSTRTIAADTPRSFRFRTTHENRSLC